MITTVQFDIPASFIIGLFFTLVARGQIRAAGTRILHRTFWTAFLFQLFVFVPIGIYLYVRYPDWSLMYFADPDTLSPVMNILVPLGYLAAMVVGFLVGQSLVRRENEKAVVGLLIGTAALLGLYSLLTLSRLYFVGEYSQFAGWGSTEATPIYKHSLGLDFVFIGLYFFVPFLIVILPLYRRNKSIAQTS